ncbi:ketoacyl-ACP synthase III [Saccharothrix sp. S26]|uniref:beta-ketoacyl-ACP synthase III n=1 Tax=Saccharothrix sp. S26 TaxID=2907215 RepID=UPI001F1EA19F|nr:beta-ketoacyl-ACP synthase III [Saccharothrix sp. S26]MCE6996344.1 ketoacyl-ACP synthase III [Saccharothrix sp. S26]
MTAAVLAGIGAYTPPTVVTNGDLAEVLDTSDEWISSRTGIRQRYVLTPGQGVGDLAVEAGRRALESAEETAGAAPVVDLVLVATTTPDRPCPATAPWVASELGLTGVAAMDVNAVCTGFLYALATGVGQIAAGLSRGVLVIGADAFSTILDPRDRTTRAVFGDGAGAVLLRRGEPDEPGAIGTFDLGSDGGGVDLITVRGGGSRQRSSPEPVDPSSRYFTMQGREVFMQAVLRMAESSRAVLARSGIQVSDVDRVVGHQANTRILMALADQLDLPADRVVSNIHRVGNTAAASIPLALADAAVDQTIHKGHTVLLTAFGGGTTWGATALEWPDVVAVADATRPQATVDTAEEPS